MLGYLSSIVLVAFIFVRVLLLNLILYFLLELEGMLGFHILNADIIIFIVTAIQVILSILSLLLLFAPLPLNILETHHSNYT